MFSIHGVTTGQSLDEVVAILGQPNSNCWVPDDSVTRVEFQSVTVRLREDRVITVRNGKSLEKEGHQLLHRGQEEHQIPRVLGQPTFLDEKHEDEILPIQIWHYRINQGLLKILTVDSFIDEIFLEED